MKLKLIGPRRPSSPTESTPTPTKPPSTPLPPIKLRISHPYRRIRSGYGYIWLVTRPIPYGHRRLHEPPLCPPAPSFASFLQNPTSILQTYKTFFPQIVGNLAQLYPRTGSASPGIWLPILINNDILDNMPWLGIQDRRIPRYFISSSWLPRMCAVVPWIPHSCVPNVEAYWNARTGRVVVVALRDIAEREGLTVTRIDNTLTFQGRQSALNERWGIGCTCSLCKDDYDHVSERIRLLSESTMEARYRGAKEYESDEVFWCPLDFGTKARRRQILDDLRKLAKLLRRLGANSVRLAKVYAARTIYSTLDGDEQELAEDSKKILKAFLRNVRGDHPMYRNMERNLEAALDQVRLNWQIYGESLSER